MKKYTILYIDDAGELNIKYKKLYSSTHFEQKSKRFLRKVDDEKKWDGANEPVFIGPNCTLSRFKVREKTSITYSFEKSQAAFFDLGDIYGFSPSQFVNSNFYVKEEYTKMGASDKWFTELLLLAKSDKVEGVTANINKILNFKKLAQSNNEGVATWLLERESTSSIIKLLCDNFNLNLTQLDHRIRYSYAEGYYVPSEKLGRDIIAAEDNDPIFDKIYDIGWLSTFIQGEAIVIDQNKYEELSKMLNTRDESNVTLAMEIMANTKFEESFHYLFMLFYNHSNEIECSKTRNHVNFKSLTKKFNSFGRSWDQIYSADNWSSANLQYVTAALIKMNQFTEEKMSMLIDLLKPKMFSDNEYYDLAIEPKEGAFDDGE